MKINLLNIDVRVMNKCVDIAPTIDRSAVTVSQVAYYVNVSLCSPRPWPTIFYLLHARGLLNISMISIQVLIFVVNGAL